MMKQRKYRAKEFEDGNDDADLDSHSNHGMSQKNASGFYGTLTDPGSDLQTSVEKDMGTMGNESSKFYRKNRYSDKSS